MWGNFGVVSGKGVLTGIKRCDRIRRMKKDFMGRELMSEDVVAFIRPFRGRLVKGYFIRSQGDKIKVRFWNDTNWDSVEVNSKDVVKVN